MKLPDEWLSNCGPLMAAKDEGPPGGDHNCGRFLSLLFPSLLFQIFS